jgi:hypothetical protein
MKSQLVPVELTRVLDSQLDPIECTDEGCGGKEVPGEFVVTRSDAPPVFDTAEVVGTVSISV